MKKVHGSYNDKYFGIKEINKSLKYMEMIHELLKNNNIKMSVGIYPWPSQILFDTKNSKIVNLMENFV